MTRKTIFKLLACLSFAAIAWLAICGFLAFQRAVEAERTLQHYTNVMTMVHDYMDKNQGKWPASWDDLDNFVKENPSTYYHQLDRAERDRRLTVRFDITGKDVAQMEVESFSAVVQNGVNYGPYEDRIQWLIDTARKYHGHDKATPK